MLLRCRVDPYIRSTHTTAMRSAYLLILLALTSLPRQAHGQADYYARLGVTFATKLLRDAIVQEFEVQQSLAPTLVLGASLPFAPTYRAGVEATLTSAGYPLTELGTESDLGTLRSGSALLDLEGPLSGPLNWRAGVGVISYFPSEDSGIFLQGGSTRFLAGAGLDYRRRVMTSWDLMVSLRYDVHRFTTEELSSRGFTGSQGVQRVSASIGLARARR
jgi:hypothetical protein